jgi:hypothetical protein
MERSIVFLGEVQEAHLVNPGFKIGLFLGGQEMKRVHAVILLSVLCFLGSWFIPSVWAKTVYVTPTGSNSNSGASWAQAKQTVVAGLTAAVSGDQVWVAAGTYNVRITLKKGVALYGGFIGTETELVQRNFRTNQRSSTPEDCTATSSPRLPGQAILPGLMGL